MSAAALRLLAVAFASVYIGLFLAGYRTVVTRTAVLPAFALYALATPNPREFLRDWAPLLLATVLYDFLRGAIYVAVVAGYLPVHVDYVIVLERTLFGTPAAPLTVQPFRTAALDVAAVLVHASHFLFFLGFGLALWHARQRQRFFGEYRLAMIVVMAVGLVGYAVLPTVPPWLAALPPYDRLPPIDHVIARVYAELIPAIYATFDTNPVAAMPSLHAAFPTVGALVGWRAFGRRVGAVLVVYAAAGVAAAMYLGEHYAVDLLTGVLLASLAVWLAARRRAAGVSRSVAPVRVSP